MFVNTIVNQCHESLPLVGRTQKNGTGNLRCRRKISQFKLLSATALAFLSAAAGTTGTGTKIDAAVELETIHLEIDLDRLRFFKKCFVDDVFVTVNLILLVRFIGLIQSHGQAGSASAALVQEDPDGLNLFVTEIRGDLLSGRWCNFEHVFLPANLIYRTSHELSGLASQYRRIDPLSSSEYPDSL
jgi:hypothetical protein